MQNLRSPKTLFSQNLLLWVLQFLDHPHHCFIKFGTHSSTPNLSSTFTETFKGNINQNLQILILRQVPASCDFVKYIQTPNSKVFEAVRRNNWRSGRLTHLLRYLYKLLILFICTPSIIITFRVTQEVEMNLFSLEARNNKVAAQG